MTNKAVFFDRDGTINSDKGHYYIFKKEDFVFNPGIIDGMKKLNAAGYLLFVVTNQGGIAKGLYTDSNVNDVHKYMCKVLSENGIEIKKIYYCPHHESISACKCRKPHPGMFIQAIDEFNINPSESFMIGDSNRDIEAAFAAGITGIKIERNSDITPLINRILKD